MGNLNSQPVYLQMIGGAVSGLIVGVLAMKVGRVIAITIGAVIIIAEILYQEGYIDGALISRLLDRVNTPSEGSVAGGIKKIFMDNIMFATAFTGGLFIGFAIA